MAASGGLEDVLDQPVPNHFRHAIDIDQVRVRAMPADTSDVSRISALSGTGESVSR
jgi:hypothetical protein